MQVAAAVADPEGDDRQPRDLQVPEQLQVRVGPPARQRPAQQPPLPLLDQVGPDGLLEGHDQPRPDRLDDRRSATLLPGHRVVQVAVTDGVDEGDGAAPGNGRDRVGDQLPAHDQDPGGLRAADELVRREEDGVLVVAGPGAAVAHPDGQVGRGGRVVPERPGAVAVQLGGDPAGVGDDPGDVGGGREAADQRPPGVADQLGLQLGEVDVAVAVLADGHHLGGRLAPGQQVGVVLERPHEHHRPRPELSVWVLA